MTHPIMIKMISVGIFLLKVMKLLYMIWGVVAMVILSYYLRAILGLSPYAGLAQLLERFLAKEEVES